MMCGFHQMKKLIEEIKQDIRDLRDSHFHFCPFELNEQVGDTRKDKIKYFEIWCLSGLVFWVVELVVLFSLSVLVHSLSVLC